MLPQHLVANESADYGCGPSLDLLWTRFSGDGATTAAARSVSRPDSAINPSFVGLRLWLPFRACCGDTMATSSHCISASWLRQCKPAMWANIETLPRAHDRRTTPDIAVVHCADDVPGRQGCRHLHT